ncbi:MAG: gliding motility protein GldD [Tannerella sp.]|jgi:gliding motility-associated lipoprotein GldD|nr:gliding motility protein GldD [Tannerella sp.]
MRHSVFFLLLACISFSCRNHQTPKPKGHLRIDLPETQYITLNMHEWPYGFNVSTQTVIETPSEDSSLYWFNIDYPELQAKIYCSYQAITPQSFREHENECRRLVEHTAGNADAINEKRYENNERHVYGALFRIEGKAASPIQFMLTDSVSGFFRGALYYKHSANADSLAPVTEYLFKDVTELIRSFYWKEEECLY